MFRDAFVDWSVGLSVICCRAFVAGNLVDDVGVRCRGRVVLDFVSRSRRLVSHIMILLDTVLIYFISKVLLGVPTALQPMTRIEGFN